MITNQHNLSITTVLLVTALVYYYNLAFFFFSSSKNETFGLFGILPKSIAQSCFVLQSISPFLKSLLANYNFLKLQHLLKYNTCRKIATTLTSFTWITKSFAATPTKIESNSIYYGTREWIDSLWSQGLF